MIEIHGLSKQYAGGVYALRDVDLTIGAGMFGLLGPNGAGKTTLMRILAGLLHPTGGAVQIFGNDMSTLHGKHAVKALLGYLPQELGLYPNLTAAEFLDYVAILKGVNDSATRRKQIAELIELVHLTDAAKRRLKTYSGGMKRRVGIAQALLGSPKLLIVDEPTSGLDPEERVRLRNMLSEMARNSTVILSTHIIEDISQSCKELAVLSKGRVLFQGAPGQLIEQARGKVWTINTAGVSPNGGLAVVSTLQLSDSIQYRVLGAHPAPEYRADEVEPSLEDGYIWLMRQSQEQKALA